jgi:hypothetical protein
MRSGPATQTAFVRGFLLCQITAWRRNDRFSPTAPQRSAAFAKASCRFVISRSRTRKPCGGQRPCPARCSRATCRVGEEAAMPGQPVALARVFWNVPRRFTLENRRLPLALPQSFGKLRNYHVSLNPLSARLLRPATQKSCAVVQKLWRMRLPCGRARKTKN